ncbi:PREDICTED: NADH dehydrogenase [ubiquinone] 1 alpha subcomplex subunit 2-like isoform X1 [Brassica oleracea var. oleracea]|uniref:Ribosomal protein/NADH dehydrogenase domain-containing protein n=1 Tax=Brassica oleracea var. oleracea TaxID=109376 RepID=A0A0D3AWR7_BRAOL|nr:PREDICTED: NADH dehydrogenase [ubiquinone] 1 alpha subcomplex subunit 2-like isoform X1 [Brassica oleracea var. oleracea]
MAWRGNISKSLKELRILLCQSSPASASARFLLHPSLSLSSPIESNSVKIGGSISVVRDFELFRFRTFVEKNYRDLKSLNPKFPFLIRECTGIQPQLWARYDMGAERCVNLDGMSESQILKSLEDLVKAGGATKA